MIVDLNKRLWNFLILIRRLMSNHQKIIIREFSTFLLSSLSSEVFLASPSSPSPSFLSSEGAWIGHRIYIYGLSHKLT